MDAQTRWSDLSASFEYFRERRRFLGVAGRGNIASRNLRRALSLDQPVASTISSSSLDLSFFVAV
ncbi:hypothetical protein [Brooklawnia cerclae]|uniref:Uncharacterized protein n=1 Tax=Brooklawnia cerclae TaxID=349934 RepID=A0ABX0SIP0_9ACTN|nr:hypothetical protein [Brooklawnia cerclae]NIH57779.1 hypothetical protein [Brooklawnia cerclae]